MRKAKLVALLTVCALLSGLLAGCAEISDGYYSDGTQATTSETTTAPEVTTSEATTTEVTTTEAVTTTEEITTVPEETEPEESSISDIEELVEPISTESEWDYSTLSTEGSGYGQGVRFDDLNRPKGALNFNEAYGEYNAGAIQETEEKTIMLTFDEGYENGYTAAILDTLAEKGVKAIFFVTYDYVSRNPELVQRMIDEGHTVGSHSWHHYSMPELTVEEMMEEIMYLHDYMIENFGLEMTLFRPPKGEYSELSLAVTADLGYKTVLWSFAYADWDTDDQPDPEESLQKLIDRAHPGAIYLLHAVSETNTEILGEFIDEVIFEGYTFVSGN
ncbi:MAG: polysaccharide deacetylase family protein [Oscillospiraceae bacterium]|nr:polysaccharide deacetylase family protein [Oscillospiraceae bacterium]